MLVSRVAPSNLGARWNKLDFVEYSSVHLENGDVEPLPMRHERPFSFSKVRRYGLGTTMPPEPEEDVNAVLASVIHGVQTLHV